MPESDSTKSSKAVSSNPAKSGNPAKANAKAKITKKKSDKKAMRIGSPSWVAPLMIAFFGIGLLWIVAYYIAPDAPFLKDLTYWNVVIGFALIACGFVVSTKWK